jgi:hypothetical protein
MGYVESGNWNDFWSVNAVVILSEIWTVEIWIETWNEA